MTIDDNNIREIEQMDDGSSIYEIGPPPKEDLPEGDFYNNLAVDFPEDGLKRLSTYLLDSIEEDVESRRDWLEAVKKVEGYTGINLEDLKDPTFKGACGTFDLTLLNAHIRGWATIRAELLPPSGPAGFKINGQGSEKLEEIGEKRRDWLNYYLTVVDKPYYSDFERLIFYLIFYGSAAKKVYYDPILKRPIARFIKPEDFIVNGDCTSIDESTRLTHVLHLSKREIILNQKNNIYREVELPYLKSADNTDDDDLNKNVDDVQNEVDLDVYTKRSLFPFYEVHEYLNLEDFKNINGNDTNTRNTVPLPYIVTIDRISKEILAIRKNWREDDPEQKRQNYFILYNYLTGFGIFGLGLAQLIGSNAITSTKLLRRLVDAASFKNMPGGIRAKGFKQQNNDLVVAPGQFVEVDTGSIPLQEAFMPLPYSEPSNVLRELRLEINADTKELGSTSEMGMLDSREDIPTGTIMAYLETSNRIQSAVLRSIHYSLTRELQLIDKLFSQTLSSETFNNGTDHQRITSEDFVDELAIIPISDPAVNSTIQRIMKARSTLETALQDPGVHNMRAVFKMNYKAQGLDEQEIDMILKPEPKEEEVLPVNPVSEVTNILSGKPVKAAIWQNHPAHILVLGVAARRPEIQNNPEAFASIKALITEHQALQYLVEMERLLGVELLPLEKIQDPQIQNSIALGLAQKLEESGATQTQDQQPLDPNTLLMADIQQKVADTKAKLEIAKMKTETDVFKAQLDFEKEKAKIESNEDIARLKAETELTKQEYQNADY